MRRRPAALCAVLAALPAAAAAAPTRTVDVSGSEALVRAIAAARPGDRIVLAPGEYRLRKIRIERGGTRDAPITLTARSPGRTRILSDAVELFKVAAPYWTFERLDILGGAAAEHAFHIVGAADYVTVRANRLRNFNAAIKSNPEKGETPDAVTVERNAIYNDAPRTTASPVTLIDVVGGDGWVVRGNFLADFGKRSGDHTSYGAFLKGGGTRGLFERNLVVCAWRHEGGRRVGLSFGDGGSAPGLQTAGNAEHAEGVMRNNIILNCREAPGIYLARAHGAKIYDNTIYDSYGIMSRFAESVSEVRNNIVSGAITAREGARVEADRNLESGLALGAYLPGGTARLIRRISEFHANHPGLFDRSDLERTDRAIARLGGWMGRSFVGRGTASLERRFVAAGLFDLDLRESSGITGGGLPLAAVRADFCGRKRGERATDLGAIEYSRGRCDVRAWLGRLLRPFGDPPPLARHAGAP